MYGERRLFACLTNAAAQPVPDEQTQRVVSLWMARLLTRSNAWKKFDLDDISSGLMPIELDVGRVVAEDVLALGRLFDLYGESMENDEDFNGAKHYEDALDQVFAEDYQKYDRSSISDDSCAGEWFRAARHCLGMNDLGEPPEGLKKLAERLEREVKEETLKTKRVFSEPFEANLSRIAQAFELSETEKMLFAFFYVLQNNAPLKLVFNLFDYSVKGVPLIAQVLSVALECSVTVKHFSSESNLFKTGLMTLTSPNRDDLEDWIEFLSSVGEDAQLMLNSLTLEEMFKDSVSKSPEPTLSLEDFEYLPEVREILLPYLNAARACGRRGVNVLIYGAPGTGKSEMARVIAKAAGAVPYDVSNSEGGKFRSESRIQRWKAAEQLFSRVRDAMLVLDEAEDVIMDTGFDGLFNAPNGFAVRLNKGELNGLVEKAAVPTIWIANSIASMDDALVRRFDFVLEMPNPPMKKRFEIAKSAFGGAVSQSFVNRLAATDRLTPGVISRAASVLSVLEPKTLEAADRAAETLVANTLKAQRRGTLPAKAEELPQSYDTAFVNADVDVKSLAEGLKATRSGRLCLYGPAGTGKSAFVRWLSRELGMPLIAKRASDLLSMWVGGTEANIARAFAEARRAGAILLIDEADSFLQERTHSEHSWEMTQVNEMLTQMESFDGIFCATTNLFETIDLAALRRFDLKAKFDFLSSKQSVRLAELEFEACKLGALSEDAESLRELEKLDSLTPGDFAAVRRAARLNPVKSQADFVERLHRECALKAAGRSKSKIGF